MVLHGAVGEAPAGLGREAPAEGLNLLGDEGGGGDVRVAEVADLLEGLACGGHRVHVQRRQVDRGGGELLVGAVVLRAQAVNPVVKVLQVNLFVVLRKEEKREGEKRWCGRGEIEEERDREEEEEEEEEEGKKETEKRKRGEERRRRGRECGLLEE